MGAERRTEDRRSAFFSVAGKKHLRSDASFFVERYDKT
jgi:hypothetical protein